MMKRYITLSLLSFSMAVSSMAQEEFTVDGISYLPTGATTASVTACSLEAGALAIIPESVEGYTVTAIAPNAFANSPVAAVYMPTTVTSIGEAAFQSCGATFIKLSPNATTIGANAFEGCQAIGHIDLPDELQRLEDSVLLSTPIYTLGNSQLPRLNYVGDYALSGTRLQHVPLTDAVAHLGTGAFSGSKLQEIHLPADMTAIPDELLSECPISEVALPAGITSIGKRAFANTGLASIDLSQYQGSIGIMAFNGCQQLERLSLPADNPHCYLSEDGKVLYSRDTKQLLSVLPTVERLTIPYPSTGVDKQLIPDLYHIIYDPATGEERQEEAYDITPILDGPFKQLQQLELPHSWQASLSSCQLPALQELTMRMPSERFSEIAPPSGLNVNCGIYVFSYAMDAVTGSPWSTVLTKERNPETQKDEYTNIHAIERPTEQLYMAEVMPMYDKLSLVEDGQVILWDADWNAALEETYPQYFTAESIVRLNTDYKSLFRNYLIQQYMTDEKFQAFKTPDDVTIQCIDGTLRFASGFDVNNFTNWYLHTNFIPATNYVPITNPLSADYQTFTQYPNQVSGLTRCTTFATDPEWGASVSEYGVFSRNTSIPTAQFALHMVPGVAYNIYAIVPPRHPDTTEEIAYRNRIRPKLEYVTRNTSTGYLQTKTMNANNTDILYESGKVDTLLIFENIQVEADAYNLFTYASSSITSPLARQGYTSTIPLIGILCEPQTELEVYPDAIQGVKEENATVVARYDLSGRRITAPQRGINIIRLSDGTTRKILVR